MKCNPELCQRKSIRLKNYDYSQAGFYFITICIQNREHLLGKINKDEILLNDAGDMIKKWYFELENKFKGIKCHEMIIMPNHFHCIIENTAPTVRADLRVCLGGSDHKKGEHTEQKGGHIGPPLHHVVQWFKTMTSNEYIRGVKQFGWRRFTKRFWQRNYWEHIIRNENEYIKLSDYIKNNPLTWNDDKLNNDSGNGKGRSTYYDELNIK